MRNILIARFVLLFGVIALTVVIVFTLSDCTNPTGPSLGTLSGDISISPSTGTVGAQLTTNYNGTETVTYRWYKDGEAIDGATDATYTPIEAGTYTVTVSAAGFKSKTSTPLR